MNKTNVLQSSGFFYAAPLLLLLLLLAASHIHDGRDTTCPGWRRVPRHAMGQVSK